MLHGYAEVEDALVSEEDGRKGLVSLRDRIFFSDVLLHWSKKTRKRVLVVNLIKTSKHLYDRYHFFMKCFELLSCV